MLVAQKSDMLQPKHCDALVLIRHVASVARTYTSYKPHSELTDNNMPGSVESALAHIVLQVIVKALFDVHGEVLEVLKFAIVLAFVCVTTHIDHLLADVFLHVAVGEAGHNRVEVLLLALGHFACCHYLN